MSLLFANSIHATFDGYVHYVVAMSIANLFVATKKGNCQANDHKFIQTRAICHKHKFISISMTPLQYNICICTISPNLSVYCLKF